MQIPKKPSVSEQERKTITSLRAGREKGTNLKYLKIFMEFLVLEYYIVSS
jgi:hypothetical protein